MDVTSQSKRGEEHERASAESEASTEVTDEREEGVNRGMGERNPTSLFTRLNLFAGAEDAFGYALVSYQSPRGISSKYYTKRENT